MNQDGKIGKPGDAPGAEDDLGQAMTADHARQAAGTGGGIHAIGTGGDAAASQVPDGPRFGPYILTAVLSRGGTGVVYQAYDTAKGRTVALKVLIPELAADQASRDRFRRELGLAARFSAPHITPVHDYGEIDGRLYIDMQLVPGTDLGTRLERDGPLSADDAAWVTAQVASALDAAHAWGLIHGDLKPSNVLIAGDQGQNMPDAQLTGFGAPRHVTISGPSPSSGHIGGPIGTVAYMAPERIQGSQGDRRADVYSLACVLYEALTGRRPFTGDMVAVIFAHLSTPPPAPTAVRPGLPAAADEVIARGMAKDPAARYGSAGELAAAMLAAVTGSGAATIPTSAPDESSAAGPPTADVPMRESDPAANPAASDVRMSGDGK
jgi:serine/threonine protein kinase